jgi:hypothetical protein
VRAAAISELKVSGPSVFGGLRRKAGARSLIASRGADHFRAQRPKLERARNWPEPGPRKAGAFGGASPKCRCGMPGARNWVVGGRGHEVGGRGEAVFGLGQCAWGETA